MSEPETKSQEKRTSEENPPKNKGETRQAKISESSKRLFPRVLILGVVLVALLGIAIWYFFLRQPAVPANLIEVSGRIETDDSSVAAKTSGRIKQVMVREGDAVAAGQTIAVMDDDQVRAREDQAQAVVTQTETRKTRSEEQIAVLQEQLNQSQIGT